jgi:hypothetical protein
MNGIVVFPVHAGVHHENRGFNVSAFAGFECHRTDGQIRRSAPLQYFDIWFLLKAQEPITAVRDFDFELPVLTEFDITVVNGWLVHQDLWRPVPTTAFIGKKEGSHNKEKTAQYYNWPGENASLFLFPVFLLAHCAILMRSIQDEEAPFITPGRMIRPVSGRGQRQMAAWAVGEIAYVRCFS